MQKYSPFSSAKEGVHVQVCLFVFAYIQDDTHNFPLILAKEWHGQKYIAVKWSMSKCHISKQHF